MSKKPLAKYSVYELNEVQKPIQKATFLHEDDKPKKKAHWSDIISCKECGKQYMRSSVSAHKKTQYHKIYEHMNKKLKKLLIE